MAPNVIALGEALLEFGATSVSRLGDVHEFKQGWGGDTSNFAIAIARLGGRAGYMSRIGGDEFGRALMERWQSEGVDPSRVRIDPDGFTGIYFITQRPEGGHDFTYFRKGSAASEMRPGDLDLDYVQSARVLHVSGISQAISQSACDTVFAAIEAARHAGVLVSYDPNCRLKLWSAHTARAIILHTVGLADIVFPSLEDSHILFGLDEPHEIAREFLKLGPRIVALKLGAGGALIATQDGLMERVPGFRVQVVDSAGAGDSFDAALILGLLDDRPLVAAAEYANAVGALTCTGLGAVQPIPTRAQVTAFMEGARLELVDASAR